MNKNTFTRARLLALGTFLVAGICASTINPANARNDNPIKEKLGPAIDCSTLEAVYEEVTTSSNTTGGYSAGISRTNANVSIGISHSKSTTKKKLKGHTKTPKEKKDCEASTWGICIAKSCAVSGPQTFIPAP